VIEEKVEMDDSQEVKGMCSNYGIPISCSCPEDGSISCDGPAGYSGDDLRSLLFFACGCSAQEQERKLKRGLESGK